MNNPAETNIGIEVHTAYIEDQSDPGSSQYVFMYTIKIKNQGQQGAKLLSRHWIITDANGQVEEVKGDGVVGEQPYIKPGETFEYTSGAVITTPVGSMHGSYQMIDNDGQSFRVEIPAFSLSVPKILH